MDIRARQKDSIVILDLSGRIDVNSANLVEAIGQCLRDGYCDIVCNLEEVKFIDYMGISVVVIAYKEVINSKGRIKFTNVPVHIRNIFCIAGLDKAVEIYPDEESALKSFSEDRIIEDIKRLQLRRRFKRLPIDIKIELKAKDSRSPQCLHLDLINLSAVGAFIFGCDKFKLGDEVVFKMKLPPNQKEIELDARVVWIPDKQVQPHAYPGMGLEFTKIPADTQQRLVEFIERNLSFMSSD
ncbi:MAG: anti-sigma factor antagonist [Candidatus Omnitrophica bacterium]|nr:anti-sigma factor antagonist [Candidatus Omnitrophota bacterium]MDD5664663.1 anti-sigma factor antagonist [Candidatus Omnitrophota bacterium]